MKRAVIVTLCFILSIFANTSFATDVTLFGPHQYIRTSGAPDVFTASFTAIPGDGVLIVKNGSVSGTNRINDAISSASVYVNGGQIFGPSDFNQNVYLLQTTVNLTENNTITVELASNPESYLTIEVKQDQQQNQPTVDLSADPLNILIGESSTLTWNSVNADACEIDQGIGSVSLNGSVSVSPAQTTTYTITATNADGTATDSVTVTVTYPAPTVSISADPETIQAGGSSTLTWSSTDADSVVIDQGIGTVATNGSVTVSPIETTTYTISVTGPGGTATANVTVTATYPPPTVSISADPETIQAGESATLTWNSTNADSAVIDQGVGTVASNGSFTVSPTETTTYTITVTSPSGTATADVTVNVSPIGISITSPLDGVTLSRPDTLVQGTIINPLGNEIGVTINGIVAMIYGNQFVANHVPLEEGENTISAIATDADGNTETTSITINAVTTGDYIGVSANSESSISPLETMLEVDGSFSFAQSTISYTGPGTVEFLDSTNPNEYNIKMTTPGIYFFTAEVTDDQSNTYTDTIAIVVLDQAQLDALLKAKWDGMKTALINGDIEQGVGYFSISSRTAFQQQFTALSSDLPQIVGDMGEISLIDVGKNQTFYDLRTTRNNETYSFQLLFIQDEDGIWRIRNF